MFTYNILQLLESVKNRPCLWDKSDDGYNDRTKRKAAWEEICVILEPKYEQLNEEMQKNVMTAITCKWANVRDTFIKAIKVKGRRKKRKYIYHDQLAFLFKVTPQSQEEYENSDYEPDAYGFVKEDEDSGENLASYLQRRSFRSEESQSTSSTELERRRKQPSYHQEYKPIEVEVDAQIEELPDPFRVMNEDEAFFASLLPTVVRYDEDERLEFRMEVLAVMKKIKEKRRWAYVEPTVVWYNEDEELELWTEVLAVMEKIRWYVEPINQQNLHRF